MYLYKILFLIDFEVGVLIRLPTEDYKSKLLIRLNDNAPIRKFENVFKITFRD